MGNEQSAPVEEMHEQYERLSEMTHILHRCNRSLLEYSQSISCSVRSVAAVAVTVLILSGCAKSGPTSVTEECPVQFKGPPTMSKEQAEELEELGCDTSSYTITENGSVNSGEKYVLCNGFKALSGRGVSLEMGECFLLAGNDNVLSMPLDSCLVRYKHDPNYFHVVACRDAAPGSCETDLGDGNVAKYMSPCSGNG